MKELEIEIKAYCDNIGDVKKKLVKMGAEYIKSEKESDCYFNHPEKDFGETDEALRIRTVDDNSVLTYKGPKISKKSKARIEKEVIVSDDDVSGEILLLLGFKVSGKVVKKRDYYTLNGIVICLDEVENLGSFVELEKMGSDLEKIESELFALADKLGLDRLERRSYLELVLAI